MKIRVYTDQSIIAENLKKLKDDYWVGMIEPETEPPETASKYGVAALSLSNLAEDLDTLRRNRPLSPITFMSITGGLDISLDSYTMIVAHCRLKLIR